MDTQRHSEQVYDGVLGSRKEERRRRGFLKKLKRGKKGNEP
jgi:hypothetical protein